MRLARRMLAAGAIRPGGPAYPAVTAYYSSPGGAGDSLVAATTAAARAVFGGSTPTCTVLAWVSTTSGASVMVAKDAAADFAPSLDHTTSVDTLDVALASDSSSAAESAATSNPLDGTWHLIGSVLDGANIFAVLDSRSVGSAYPGGTFAAADAFEPFPEFAAGKMCQPAIWTRALSAAEVDTLRAAGPAVDMRQTLGTSGLAFLWRDALSGGSVAHVGSGAACALTAAGAVTSEAL